jgi:bifunctional non-homologous end joining protein LigD
VLDDVEPQRFTVTNVRRRLAQREDPWRDVRRHAQGLGKARERLARVDA